MKFSAVLSALCVASAASAFPTNFFKRDSTSSSNSTTSKTILLTNDDGWQSTNIRATYNALTAAGYDVVLVAPVSQRSGYGGQFGLPPTVNLTTGGEFNYPAAGAPSWGHEQDNQAIWYFNGTPSSSVAFGLEYVIPNYFNNKTVDLVVAGPNEGTNLSPMYYTLSGTIAATYTAVARGYPAIAFSGSNTNNSFFKDTLSRANDSNFAANIYAKKVVEFVDILFNSSANHPSLLPVTTGINVNFPKAGELDSSCTDPEFVFSRLSGPGSASPNLAYNQTTGLFVFENEHYGPTEKCIFGDCDLPSESWVLSSLKCKSSVSVFSIDYDASYKQAQRVETYLKPLFA